MNSHKEFKEFLINTIELKGIRSLIALISNKKELKEQLNNYSIINSSNISEKIFCIINNINKIPLCICGNNLKFKSYNNGYNKYCSNKCSNIKTKITFEEFVKRSKEVHNDNFEYYKEHYINIASKTKIRCKKHDTTFYVYPNNHIIKEVKCPQCYRENIRKKLSMDVNEFIKKSNKVHNNKYNYSQVKYVNQHKKVKIICPEHGVFEQVPLSHLKGHGCKKCVGLEQIDKEEFIRRSKINHGNNFIYDFVLDPPEKYSLIVCKKHGIYKQLTSSHMSGRGCRKCKKSIGELIIQEYLDKNRIGYLTQYKFKECRNIRQLMFDFYIPDHNICIEYDGEQHFKPVSEFGGIEHFKKQKINDEIKNLYCKNNNINLIRIPYWEKENINSILNGIF